MYGKIKTMGKDLFRNDNPDKGTEVYLRRILQVSYSPIRNDNPDKGTETNIFSAAYLCFTLNKVQK